MSTLVLTNTVAGAGALQQAGIGDTRIAVSMLGAWAGLARFSIEGPLPGEAETAAFFGGQQSREPLFWQSGRGPIHAGITPDRLMGLVGFCRGFDTVECWFDPDLDGQLNLVHLLDCVRSDPATAGKFLLVHPAAPLGSMAPSEIDAELTRTRLGADHLHVAHRVWNAYRQPTPRAVVGLLSDDLTALPHLAATLPRLLAELPHVDTALGATETQLLTLAARPDITWHALFAAFPQRYGQPAFSYGYAKDALERLGDEPAPALAGVLPDPTRHPGAFDAERFRAHRTAVLSLTALGRALVAGKADAARHRTIHRWWGNTELCNRNLWRWDPVDQILLDPA